MKKTIIYLLLGGGILWIGSDYLKIIPYINQLSKPYIPISESVQPVAQVKATFVGSAKCVECHEDEHNEWSHSRHATMISDVRKRPKAIVGDFATLPKEANFTQEEIVYTIGGKFKQRYMINMGNDYRIGNYQYNLETKKWQPYDSFKDWYHDGFDNATTANGYTSKTCDGCHFTGFMSTQKRVEPSIACEACHGAGSEHIKDPTDENIYKATSQDPHRATEVCLQCHMRNRDFRLSDSKVTLPSLLGDVRDYPLGYEVGKPLVNYKLPAPNNATGTDEFYANGVAKKNRTQGNEYVHSRMYAHGITCVNCHNPHKLDNTADKPLGDESCMKCHSFGSIAGPHAKTIEEHTRHKKGSPGSSCIECHMPKVGKHLGNSPTTVRSHMFGFITPSETKQYGSPNACNNCHKDKDVDWAIQKASEWGMNGGWEKIK